MAGDWIKIEHALPNKPEVMAIAEELDISDMEVVGHLVLFWTWVDQNFCPVSVPDAAGQMSEVCPRVPATIRGLDRVAGCSGFANALIKVGWLTFENGQVEIPNYEDHLSQSAKYRAVEAKRKRRQRAKKQQEMSGTQRDKRGTKHGQKAGLEKRRVSNTPQPPKGGGVGFEKTDGLGKIRKRDMEQPERLDAWILANVPAPVSADTRLKIFACAIHALREAKRSHGRMMQAMVERGLAGDWTVPDDDIQAASKFLNQSTENRGGEMPQSLGEILEGRHGEK